MLTNHLDLNLPNQPLSKPKQALQASAFSTYFLLEAMLHLILCSCCLYDHSVSLFSVSSSQSLPIPVSLWLSDFIDIILNLYVCFQDLFTSEGQIPVANICWIAVFLLQSFSLERGLQTTPWFHVSVPQRSCIQGRATWSLQLELCYANTIRCTEVISSPYGLNV